MSYLDAVTAVRASYPDDKRRAEAADDLPFAVVYRPISFWVTPLFLAAGISANAVTVLSLGVALAMPLAAWTGGARGALLVVALALVVQVLDCVDGNVARMTGGPTPAGHVLDHLTTVIFWCAYFVAIGVLATGSGGVVGRHGLTIGLALAALLLLQRHLEDAYDAWFPDRPRWAPPLPESVVAAQDPTSIGRVVEHVAAFGLLAVAGVLGRLELFLALVALYQGGLFLAWLPRFAMALRRRT